MNLPGKRRVCFAAGAGVISAMAGVAISYSSGLEAAVTSAGVLSALSASGMFLRIGRQREYWPDFNDQENDSPTDVSAIPVHAVVLDTCTAEQVDRWLRFSAKEAAHRSR